MNALPIRALLVEDNPADARLIRALLADAQRVQAGPRRVELETVDRLSAAREALGRGGHDVILLDLSLPDSQGLGTLTGILRCAPATAVVVLSGTGDEQIALQAVEAGAQDYLMKGQFDGPLLQRAIRYALERQDSRHILQSVVARLRLKSSALEAAANAILITDREGVIVWVNAAFTTFTGYDAVESIGRKPAELLKSGRHDGAFYQAMWATINAGQVWQGELINRRKDGSIYPEEMTITPLRNDAGEITHFIAVKLDITLRKRAEEALHESEQRHRMLFQNNPLPMWVYDTGTLAFLSVNQTALLQYGYTEAEFLAMTIREIRPAEDLARLDEDLAAPAAGKEFSGPWRHRKKNGELIEVEISSDAIRFAGRPARLVLASDITARQRAAWRAAQLKIALTKSAREWQVTFDTLDIPVMLVGADGIVRRMNRAARELTGRDFPESIGRSLPQLSGVFPWSRTLALIKQAMETKQSAGAQLRDHASSRIWDCLASYFHNPAAGDDGVVFSAREITRLVKLQESLRRGETLSALGSLVSGVAHEVRNPLFGITATLDAFEANHGDRPEFREYLSILRSESERLSTLMKDLLDYGRPPELNPDHGSIESLLQDALKPILPLAQPASVRLVLECATGLPEVSFDRSRLPQVFINLLDNAVRHSPSGGTVRLSAALAAEPGWLEIAVLDEGPGIRPEDIPRLFQPFFTRRAGGTGLGLAIVQRIVEQHGGQVTAANRPEGGAVFTVRLPIGDPPD